MKARRRKKEKSINNPHETIPKDIEITDEILNGFYGSADGALRSEVVNDYVSDALKEYNEIFNNNPNNTASEESKPGYTEKTAIEVLIEYLEYMSSSSLDTSNLIEALNKKIYQSVDNDNVREIVIGYELLSVVSRLKKGETLDEIIDSLKNQVKKPRTK